MRPDYPDRMSVFARMRFVGTMLVAAGASGGAFAVTEPPPDPVRLGLYEWMGTAPIVISAEILVDDGKFVQAVSRTTIKGGLAEGTVVLVDLKRVNRDREVGVRPLDLAKGHAYLLLLKPSGRDPKDPHPLFDLVRGLTGARELPAEGAAAVVDAAIRLAKIQERKNDALLWASVQDLLDDPNPVLVDAALELVIKFRRESADLIPVVAPLLESPRPDIRRRAVLLVGRVLAKPGTESLPERGAMIGELTGRARRDDDAEVRQTATAALAILPDAGIDETLRTIGQDDPDQNVRFEAEKALYERKQNAALRRSD
jgi:hypothetical protein